MLEPIELSYALVLLPAPPLAFRRWRWELWHGPQLLAAGWRTGVGAAQRALQVHALRYAHRRLGLHLLRPDLAAESNEWRGASVAVENGGVRVLLHPREELAA